MREKLLMLSIIILVLNEEFDMEQKDFDGMVDFPKLEDLLKSEFGNDLDNFDDEEMKSVAISKFNELASELGILKEGE